MEASRPTEGEGALPAWTSISRGRTGAGALMPWIRWVLPLRTPEQVLLLGPCVGAGHRLPSSVTPCRMAPWQHASGFDNVETLEGWLSGWLPAWPMACHLLPAVITLAVVPVLKPSVRYSVCLDAGHSHRDVPQRGWHQAGGDLCLCRRCQAAGRPSPGINGTLHRALVWAACSCVIAPTDHLRRSWHSFPKSFRALLQWGPRLQWSGQTAATRAPCCEQTPSLGHSHLRRSRRSLKSSQLPSLSALNLPHVSYSLHLGFRPQTPNPVMLTSSGPKESDIPFFQSLA